MIAAKCKTFNYTYGLIVILVLHKLKKDALTQPPRAIIILNVLHLL